VALWGLAGLATAAPLKVAALHPLLADLAREVGGERVEVVDLTGPNADPHKFEPGARELDRAREARLFLLSGKGLEPYHEKLRDLAGAERILNVGETLPDRTTSNVCGEGGSLHHHHGGLDPHWWHSVDCWRRAARIVAKRFGELDAENAGYYLDRARSCRERLAVLDRWIRAELARVPPGKRVLAVAHAAFGYFCDEYGWRMVAVQGLNRERVTSPKFVGELARLMRREGVGALFPEEQSNPKMLRTLSESLGVKLAEPLIASGTGSIEAMFRHNVGAIVTTLAE